MEKDRNITSYLFDVVAFVVALLLAYFLKWKTTDLVWSLWLSSLVIGYLTIVTVILGDIFNSRKSGNAGAFGDSLRKGLFTMLFFFFHFGVFHLVHAMFLIGFFPLGTENKPFEIAPDASIGGIGSIFIETIFRYGIFLLPAILVQRTNLLKPFANRNDQNSELKNKGGFAVPYKNVIKMHVLIFFFAACSFLKLEHFWVYAVVYSFFFFPIEAIWRKGNQVNE